jgi:hypothetical protein
MLYEATIPKSTLCRDLIFYLIVCLNLNPKP